ncbi:Metallophosphoesterase domain-containing protein 1,Metallophosphoesterase MPPED2 [Lepeophtheirus salmonis]|uniref:Metallophosphoesterase domain-containing protein 1,Metallophosphoesterase MPPED2 n=1 Tax=Lepeophtheirus salmonis TaxID=72036 RepID=A0A7R8CZR6_LEPSM|nr:Metallophosphoesterase domain-containing protein 1,Metallophosphoesterase MPPED2 [Lepeophtheirus salmonis]CAF2952611.1 Metallophosphoesterase domain-containing protein 1,Metallophosphoesterase MPPED2 [Lepeophtheirus salmonis]
MDIGVHPLTINPTQAWETMKPHQHVMRFKVKNPKDPPGDRKARIVCMSDTHSLTSHITREIPEGDIFHSCWRFYSLWSFQRTGNHELSLDESYHPNNESRQIGIDIGHFLKKNDETKESFTKEDIRKELTNCVYLQDSYVTVYGLKIYGTPWQPEFGGWAFNLKRGSKCLDKWDLIPDDTDILITHSPPVGYGDHCSTGVRAGCVELLNTVQRRVKPKYHIYGHIHEGYGVRSDGKIVFINASTCNVNYVPNNKPIVIDVPIPEGFSKAD